MGAVMEKFLFPIFYWAWHIVQSFEMIFVLKINTFSQKVFFSKLSSSMNFSAKWLEFWAFLPDFHFKNKLKYLV